MKKPKYEIKINDKFGILTVIEDLGKHPAKGRCGSYNLYKCSCECGNTVDRFNFSLRNRGIKSCGCLVKNNLEKGRQALIKFNKLKRVSEFHVENYVYKYYKANADRRKISFELSPEDFLPLLYEPCYYCGDKQTNEVMRHGDLFKYNGLDRVDNSKGYLKDNVVPCCKTCNKMKNIMNQKDFLGQAKKIASYSS
jgi:hypothetical protein